MLKDITFGQYFPGDSLLHRLDPRTKLILTLIFIVTLFTARHVLSYGILLAYLVFAVILSGIRPGVIFRGLKPIVVVVIITGILNLFYTPGIPLWSFWIFSITAEGIRAAVFMVLRILMLITGTLLLTYTTSPILLTDAMERLMKPLKVLRVPVHELAMMMSIALRFIPTLLDETDKIMSAQKARGADFESGGLMQRARALLPLLVPLFVSAFRRADELAVAMECRCYHGGEGRTRLRVLRFALRDYLAMIFGIALGAGVTVLGVFGM
ncbi:energy-coupling factor transporter transmembrane component T family protein [Papillibacter cinnamivorans]|uniref:Energy-coupling factor transporter transmembrane protein EcfT n=1 Tax=Papillibacter cinnamivorans DSM 12816 TaxID=1122930 RepID=A0A1W2B8Y3_9FIRM|nr:energy-coupling factor transporter transmembrane component T [Papillibacter cinnamivorans]SMC68828.1 energy-coupling factor transport system permease protein [Papillibacter cinnamivorans DSM 12816]